MNRVSIGPENGLSPIRRQAIISTNAGLFSIYIFLIKMQNFSFTKMHLKISSAKWRPWSDESRNRQRWFPDLACRCLGTLSYCRDHSRQSLLLHLEIESIGDISIAIEIYISCEPMTASPSSPPRQNGCIMNKKFCISIHFLLKFVPSGPIDIRPALVQVMAWRRTGDMPLSELMLTQFTDAYMRH